MTNKAKKITFIAVASVLIFVAGLAMIILIPRQGKKMYNVWGAGDEFDVNSVTKLEKKQGEDFKILLFTDIQLWTAIGDNKRTLKMMDELVEKVKPDLIILPGDNVSGVSTDILTLQLVKKMESYGIPWAPVFGNHDSEGNATLEWQADKFDAADNCIFDRGPSNLYGVGNYFVNIVEGDNIAYSLALLDNGRYYRYDESTIDEVYMGYEQIAWYEWNMRGIAKAYGKERVPSMTFSHCAPPEFNEAMEKYGQEGADGIYYVPEEYGFGYCQYLPSVAPKNSGFIDKAKALGLTHVFVGHDHENNASIKYEDVIYTYGLKTGPSPKPWNAAKEYGGTVISIGDNGAVSIANEVIETVK